MAVMAIVPVFGAVPGMRLGDCVFAHRYFPIPETYGKQPGGSVRSPRVYFFIR